MKEPSVWLRCFASLVLAGAPLLACGDDPTPSPADAGVDGDVGVDADAGELPDTSVTCSATEKVCNGACAVVESTDDRCGAGACAVACGGGNHCLSGTCVPSKIEHVVLIAQENHTFDSYFGRYCRAAAGSNPSCIAGRDCCEAAPATEAHGAAPGILDDDSNFATDRDHDSDCELAQINGGAMDQFVTGASGASTCLGVGPRCSAAANWVVADGEAPGSTVHYYWDLANKSALADRYFQPIVGGTSSNDVYMAGAHFRFFDNQVVPDVAVGLSTSKADRLCTLESSPASCVSSVSGTFTDPNIASLLLDAGKTFKVYADGYAGALAARIAGGCQAPASVSECPYKSCSLLGGHPVACHACVYDPSDMPFVYYDRFADTAGGPGGFTPSPYVTDYAQFANDLATDKLPAFSYVKARSYRNEHPNVSTITDGIAFVKKTIDAIQASSLRESTLVILTWDEGGGFYDHVSPPPAWPIAVDADDAGHPVPYGTRVPFLAIGPFAKSGTVSHETMEHSSIVKFLEWNFLTKTGQLQARDAVVNNLGSLLDAAKTGLEVPAH